jgi:hypothetical protein
MQINIEAAENLYPEFGMKVVTNKPSNLEMWNIVWRYSIINPKNYARINDYKHENGTTFSLYYVILTWY